MGVRGGLVDEADPEHGGHLHVVGDVELGGGGGQQGRDVHAQDLGGGQVHAAAPDTHSNALSSGRHQVITAFDVTF